MRHIRVFFISLLLVPNFAYSQTGDGGAGWANNILLRLGNAQDKIFQNKLLLETRNTIKLLRESKEIVGTVSATMKDMKNVTELFQNDLKRITALSEMEMEGIRELFSFRNELDGNGYQSLFNLSDWYMTETSPFRDRNGFMNAASAIISATSPERALSTHVRYREHIFQMQRNVNISTEYRIISLLKEASQLDREARLRTMQLNLALMGTSVVDLGNGIGEKLFNNSELIKVKDKPFFSQEHVNFLFDQVRSKIDAADQKRAEAMELYWQNILMNEPAVNRALQTAIRQRIQNQNSILVNEYRSAKRGSVVPLSFEKPTINGIDQSKWRNSN